MEFTVQVDSTLYDISELVTKVSYTDKLNDGCSKLEFSYINDNLVITNGSTVRFKYNDSEIFNGHVFKVSRDDKKEISVTAYDQLRYCKAKDVIVVDGDTTTTLVKRMCHYFNLRTGTLTDTGYVLDTNVHDDKTWLDMIYAAISDTLLNKGSKYALRDEFGAITLRNLEDLRLNLILGDESLCYGYDYEKSIDDEFYNQIKIYLKGETSRDSQFVSAKDETSIEKYGMLQYFEASDENSNASKAKKKADILLKLYNREVETLSLECLGDTRIRAGTSFYAYISDIGLNKSLFVKQVTHKFLPNHTMSLEVSI
ncbi:XkdQ/YqbQ family protein [Clostridium aminobutyricum]|uniref:YqbQ/XkdQ domain-containing protein n=1 Tax=Clostridium aminobutyricum TaxID=33953 RepID=A0A939D8M9_CLOAM|nr:hypothetical protein [Clostridium aminobutyricum]MBN7773145.1 hypothetical protein [Clostridium aminobutyricum]